MSRNYSSYDTEDIPYDTWQYMGDVANSARDGLVHSVYGSLWVKRDLKGYIINPENMDLKCGWGPSVETAYIHFLERNGDVGLF